MFFINLRKIDNRNKWNNYNVVVARVKLSLEFDASVIREQSLFI